MSGQTWQERAQRKRESLQALLPSEFKLPEPIPSPNEVRDATTFPRRYLSDDELRITETDNASELLGRIAKGELKARDVVSAFCHRATIAHQLTNCLSEVLFASALQRADELDAYLAQYGKTVGPLHGLPVSLKDTFRVAGAETTVGYVGWLGPKDTEESESLLVKELKDAGAVVIAKTSVPTGLMSLETNNHIVGYTVNAWNRMLSSGGSSGGEGPLLSMRGSMLGFGTDIGGSIRVPAGISNLYGLTPSHGRLPFLKVATGVEGLDLLNIVSGPMGHSVSDLKLIMQTILDTRPWLHDPAVLVKPWQKDKVEEVKRLAEHKDLTFAVLRHDQVVMPTPPVKRALETVVRSLQDQGHEVIEWTPPPHAEVQDLLYKIFTADGGIDIHSNLALSGEEPLPHTVTLYGRAPGDVPAISINESWNLQKRRSDYRRRYLEYWNSTANVTRNGRAVDFVLLPVLPSASFRPGESNHAGYTTITNLLDYTAAVLPVTKVIGNIDKKSIREHFLGDLDRLVYDQYDPALFHNVPVGVQVMGRRLEEERVLAAVAEISRCLQLVDQR